VNSVFQNVNKTQVPTQFLREYGYPFLPINVFNGTLVDSNRTDIDAWRMVYASFLTSYVGTTAPSVPTLSTINTALENSQTTSTAIPIVLLHANYNDLRSDALTANLMTISNEQIFDVAGRTQSPYQSKTLFAAAPYFNYSNTAVTQFIIDNNFICKNTGAISSIAVDFADGLGYRTVTLGTAINVSYAAVGTYRVKVKLTPTSGAIVESWFDFNAKKANCSTCRYKPDRVTFLNDPTFLPSTAHSGAKVEVILSINNLTGRIRKPLIVAEGFDPSFIAPSLSPDFTVNEFIGKLPTFFNDNLDSIASYDLVFINFRNGADDIKRNALLLQAVIRKVNAEKALGGSTHQNVVMGLSMGGLVARFGLAQMVRNGENTQTRLLITHDSPHRGANVPLGLQMIVRNIGLLTNTTGGGSVAVNPFDILRPLKQLQTLLDAPATAQQIINRATSPFPSGVVSNTFLANGGEYRTMVDNLTTPYQLIATSNGSQCGIPLFNPATQILNGDVGGYLGFEYILSSGFRTSIVVTASANQSANEIANWRVYSQTKIFTIPINITLYRFTANSPAIIPIDGVAGGTIATIRNGSSESWWFPLFGYSTSYSGTEEFCFVPTASALDATNFNASSLTEKYVNSVNISNPSKFSRFIAQEQFQRVFNGPLLFNERHIRFRARNSQWLFDQMENLTNGNNTNQECTNECQTSGLAITGNSLICTSGTYTANAPPGTTVTWTVAPAGVATLTSNGSTATLTRIINGNVVLTAQFGGCLTSTLNVQVGAPITNFSIIEDVKPCPPKIKSGEYRISPLTTNTTYAWQCTNCGSGGVSISGSQGELGTVIITSSRTFNFTVTATNSCGGGTITIAQSFTTGTNCNALRVALSPNPTVQNKISLNVVDDDTNKSGVVDNSYQVTISDSFGNIKLDKKFTTPDNDINVSSFNVGTYSIRIIKGQGIVSKTFSVMR
jgi:PKD-like domain